MRLHTSSTLKAKMHALIVTFLLGLALGATAAPLEDGDAAYRLRDYATALRLWRPLADQGIAKVQFNLGLMYEKGQGVAQDYAEAAKWYRLSANQGNAMAQFSLGLMYEKGQGGVAHDYEEAGKWFQLAANQGNATAQFRLGLMYENGRGVAQDYVEAHRWFNLAGAVGNKDAAKYRSIVERKMTREQIAEALRRAAEWKPIVTRP